MAIVVKQIGGGTAANSFETIQCPAGTSPVADSTTDTLTLTSTNGCVTITGDSTADSIDLVVTPTNKMLRAYTDCTESAAFTGDWASSVVSGGSISYGTAPETSGGKYFQGIHQLSTGTTGSTNARALLTTGQGTMCFGGGVWKFIGVIKTPAALSDASNTYQIQVGFSDSATGIVDGALFYYTHSLSANWYCRTISNSTITSTDTATAVVVDTWTKFEIRVNADGSSVTFYMNDSLVATHTTNIPTGVARSLGCLTSIRRNDTNTTSRTMAVDMAYVENLHTTAR